MTNLPYITEVLFTMKVPQQITILSLFLGAALAAPSVDLKKYSLSKKRSDCCPSGSYEVNVEGTEVICCPNQTVEFEGNVCLNGAGGGSAAVYCSGWKNSIHSKEVSPRNSLFPPGGLLTQASLADIGPDQSLQISSCMLDWDPGITSHYLVRQVDHKLLYFKFGFLSYIHSFGRSDCYLLQLQLMCFEFLFIWQQIQLTYILLPPL
jgi:hypothetical protein